MMYAIESDFNTPKSRLNAIQDLLGRYNGRFRGNPVIHGDKSRVTVGFDDLVEYRKFCTMVRIVEQPYYGDSQ